MDEPNRLYEEGGRSSLERALLGAGASYRSSAQARAKVMAGLGLAAGSATLLGGSAAAASVSSAAKVTWTKLLLGVSLVGATAVPVGYYALLHQTSSAPAQHAVQSGAVAAEPTPEAAAPDRALAPSAAAARAMLTDELDALDHARLALASGDAHRALDELDAYDRRFPSGRLQLEGEVLRIDALAKTGRKDAARQHAGTFLKRHPNSVLATRVRALNAD
jgi:hypothetical protein